MGGYALINLNTTSNLMKSIQSEAVAHFFHLSIETMRLTQQSNVDPEVPSTFSFSLYSLLSNMPRFLLGLPDYLHTD